MRTPTLTRLALLAFLPILTAAVLPADEAPPVPKAAPPGTLIVIDAAGKEQTLKAWEFSAGVRRLGWLATPQKEPAGKEPAEKEPADGEEPPKGKRPAPKPPAGPEALIIRDEKKFNFAAGVLTYVPLDRVRSVDFDATNETMTVRAATSDKPEEDVILTGTTSYKGINKLTLVADVDKGEAGVASVTFQGGVPRGIRGVRFPAPKVTAGKEAGRPAVVLASDKGLKKVHKVTDFAPLYRAASGAEVTLPTLMFKKTLKIDLGKVRSLAVSEDAEELTYQVVMKDGEDSSLVLLMSAPHDGKPAALEGFVARAPAGWKYFPTRRVGEVHFDTTDDPREKEPLAPKPKEKTKGKAEPRKDDDGPSSR